MNSMGFLQRLYSNRLLLDDKDMRISRRLSIFEGCTARTILTLTSGAFLVGFAKYLGASDQISGIISAIPVLASIIMAISPVAFERLQSRKLLVVILCIIGRLSLGGMIFVPLLADTIKWRIALIVGIFLFASLALAFTLPAAQSWILSLTPQEIRGRYFGIREFYVLGFVTVATLIMGWVLDSFKHMGNEFGGFVIVYLFVFILAVLNFTIFSAMKEQPLQKNETQLGILEMISLPLKNKQFSKVILLLVIWNVGFQISAPFSAVYMVSGLKLGYIYITVMAMLASFTSVAVVRFWGKLADRKSWIFLMKFLIIIQIISYFLWFLTDGATARFLIPLAHIFGGAAASGINIAVFNIQFSYAPKNYKTVYMGFSSAVGALTGFVGTLSSSAMIGWLKPQQFNMFGLTISSFQVLFILSCMVLLGCFAFIRLSFDCVDGEGAC